MSKFTGSFVNLMAGRSKYSDPEVGMGATVLMWTDRRAATIIEVSKSGKSVKVQRDNVKRIDKRGMSESQEYEFTPNPEAHVETYTLRKNGAWVAKGSSLRGGTRLAIGHRDEYYDFSF